MNLTTIPYSLLGYANKTNGATLARVALFVGIVLWSFVIARWYLVYSGDKQSNSKASQVAKVQAVELAATSNYPPVKMKKQVKIHLINGSGNAKEEAEIVAALVGSGYSKSNIKVGASEVVDGLGTTITANADYEAIVAHIRNVLLPIIPDITDGIPNSDPNFGSGYDVVIITGSKSSPL